MTGLTAGSPETTGEASLVRGLSLEREERLGEVLCWGSTGAAPKELVGKEGKLVFTGPDIEEM